MAAASTGGRDSARDTATGGLAPQLALGLGEAAKHGAVDDLVADAHRNPAEHGGVDHHLQHDLGAEGAGDGDAQPVGLLLVDRAGDRDDGDGTLTTLRRRGPRGPRARGRPRGHAGW